MSSIYIDCSMGAAGDMLCAALYELLDGEDAGAKAMGRAAFVQRFNAMFADFDVVLQAEAATRCGVCGTHFRITVAGAEETADGVHHAESGHTHHTTMADIAGIVDRLKVSDAVKAHIIEVYRLIATAESKVHGVNVEEVHFHEVGALDAIADVTAFTMLLEMLQWPRLTSSAVNVGSGFVHCAHGVLPVPAPATAWLLRGIPYHTSAIEAELATPTGAALLRHFVAAFDAHDNITTSKIGCGMGTREFAQCNCVRAFLCADGANDMGNGHPVADMERGSMDEVAILECEIDDMTGEGLGFAAERLMEEGALDVHMTAVQMKMGRPGVSLTCICRPCDGDKFASIIFNLTTTLGVRLRISSRYVLDRVIDTQDTDCGTVRVKTATGWGARHTKCEERDLARIARAKGVSLCDAALLCSR